MCPMGCLFPNWKSGPPTPRRSPAALLRVGRRAVVKGVTGHLSPYIGGAFYSSEFQRCEGIIFATTIIVVLYYTYLWKQHQGAFQYQVLNYSCGVANSLAGEGEKHG